MGSNYQVDESIIFFDGVCNLCNESVQFIIKRDKKRAFQYASLQSDYAKKILPNEFLLDNLDDSSTKSIVLLDNEKFYSKSDAIIRILKKLSGGWKILYYVGLLVPKFIRDALYSIVSKNRYIVFGKKDECMLPLPELKALFFE